MDVIGTINVSKTFSQALERSFVIMKERHAVQLRFQPIHRAHGAGGMLVNEFLDQRKIPVRPKNPEQRVQPTADCCDISVKAGFDCIGEIVPAKLDALNCFHCSGNVCDSKRDDKVTLGGLCLSSQPTQSMSLVAGVGQCSDVLIYGIGLVSAQYGRSPNKFFYDTPYQQGCS